MLKGEQAAARYMKTVEPTIPADLVSVPLAARVTGFGTRTIYGWIRTGKIRAWGRRRCYRVSLSEVLAPVAEGA